MTCVGLSSCHHLSQLRATPLGWGAVTVEVGELELAADRAKLKALRRNLGEHLATYRRAAGVSQPELSLAMGRTRTRTFAYRAGEGARGVVGDDGCGG